MKKMSMKAKPEGSAKMKKKAAKKTSKKKSGMSSYKEKC